MGGPTLRRCLERWMRASVLRQGHAMLLISMLVPMLRDHPDLILDSCSVRAERGGELTSPNPTNPGNKANILYFARRISVERLTASAHLSYEVALAALADD